MEDKLSDKHKQLLTNILNAFEWTSEDFLSDYNNAYSLIISKDIKREDRISKQALTRTLICSGLPRNAESQKKNRDWGKIALAAVLETAVVASYRKTLLTKCHSAHRLRRELEDYLFNHKSDLQQITGSLKLAPITSWLFLDGISI